LFFCEFITGTTQCLRSKALLFDFRPVL